VAIAVAVAIFVATAVPFTASADEPLAGSAGVDTALPPTASAVTVSGRGAFSGLKVSVNQTASLTNQAVSVTWTGATPATSVGDRFVQIFQCWGDDDGSVPSNPGPPPEQCEFGGQPFTGNLSSKLPADVAISNEFTRAVTQASWPGFDPNQGVFDPGTGKVWKPFKSVDGTQVDEQLKVVSSNSNGVSVAWQNPYFDFNSTNEDDFGRTYLNGTGSELFQLDTGLEAPGLGCGQSVQAHPDGSKTIPKCWLVIVPRGTAADENPPGVDPNRVATSPLAPAAWQNRIAIPLQFNPVDSPCAIGADERRLVGSELATTAITNWQPTLCAAPGSPPYAYGAISDDQARQQLLSGQQGAPGMAVISRPIDPTTASNPVVYAPLTLSGLTIGFNVERQPFDLNGTIRDPDEAALAGVRVAHINLTPRLVAKLLTQSYRQQFFNLNVSNPPPNYQWVINNPSYITADPDFIQFNPEFQNVFVGSFRTASGVIVESSTSDSAFLLWNWVLSDPEASAWLAGAPDPWGMRVNPLFSTNPSVNPSGIPFGSPPPNSFPRNDPYCYQDPAKVGNPAQPVRPLCMLDTQPLALSLQTAAQETRAANDGAKLELDPFAASPAVAYISEGPERQGNRSLFSITDTASAARYGLQTASLSRAGDDAASRSFTAPDQAGLLAGVDAMAPSSVSGVSLPAPTTQPNGAYPLTMLTYGAVSPSGLDQTARNDYAAFIEYAAGPGQEPGLAFGQLPPGYAPLPDALRAQARDAAAEIRNGGPAGGSDNPTGSGSDGTFGSGLDGSANGLNGSAGGLGGLNPSAAAAKSGAAGANGANSANAKRASSTTSTPNDHVGFVRYLLPAIVIVGLAANLGALALNEPKKKVPGAVPASVGGSP
jgi:hypothetical protein